MESDIYGNAALPLTPDLQSLQTPQTIPKTSPSNRRNTLWFNNECKIAIRLWNAALHKFKKEPLTSNLNSFKLLRAKARKTIKEAKKISWQNYVNKLHSSIKTKSRKETAKFLAKTSLLQSNTSLKIIFKLPIKKRHWRHTSGDLLSKFLLHKFQHRISHIQRQERKTKA